MNELALLLALLLCEYAERLRPAHGGGHLWDNGWATAKYTKKYREKHWFKYSEDKEEGGHSLKLEDYGILKTWVIIKKDGGRRPPPRLAS